MQRVLLDIQHLSVDFVSDERTNHALKDISVEIKKERS